MILSYAFLIASSISVSGSPSTVLTISSATAGQQPDGTGDASSTTYTIEADTDNMVITGQVNATTANTTLLVNLTAPPGATSSGAVELDTAPKNLVTGIPSGPYTGQNFSIEYLFQATVDAPPMPLVTKVVTLTLTSG